MKNVIGPKQKQLLWSTWAKAVQAYAMGILLLIVSRVLTATSAQSCDDAVFWPSLKMRLLSEIPNCNFFIFFNLPKVIPYSIVNQIGYRANCSHIVFLRPDRALDWSLGLGLGLGPAQDLWPFSDTTNIWRPKRRFNFDQETV